MKIAVDARLLSRPLTGIGRYTLEMCSAVLKIEGVSLSLYSPSPISYKVRECLSSAQFREMNWRNGFLMQLWAESYLPLWAKRDKVDIFWGPAHRLPRLLSQAIPRVVTIHDLVWKHAGWTMHPATYFLEKVQMPWAVRNADMVITDAQSTLEALKQEFNICDANVEVIPLAAACDQDVAPFDSLAQLGINGSYFLFVGTLEPRKNLTRLLKAYSLLPDAVKLKATLVIAGGKGWGRVNLKKEVAELGLGNYVRLLGYVDDATLGALYAHAQFLAMPSIYEGFGLPLLEAMVYGTPVLAANNSSMPEIVGNSGVLVEALDTDSISSGLNQLITDDVLRMKLARNAVSNAARYSWEVSAKELVEVLDKVISHRRVRG
jgi:glycosyltransferase involved in cell wall biosynthesis